MKRVIALFLLFFLSPALAQQTQSLGPSYVAGTWSPAISAVGTAGTPAYTTQVGSYETIGRQTTARLTLTLSGWTGVPSGNVTITMPVAAVNTAGDNGGCYGAFYTVTGLAASNFAVTATIAVGTTTASLLAGSSTTSGNVTAAQTGLTPTIVLICNYRSS